MRQVTLASSAIQSCMQPTYAPSDLASGRLLQRSLLPQKLPEYPGLDIAADVWTAVDLGGDYYQFLEQPGILSVAIADSSGKSVAGAIHAALFKGQLAAYAEQSRLQNPVSVLTSLNKLLCEAGAEDAVALSYGALDLGNYEFSIGNAGIPGPVIYSASSRTCEEVMTPGIALGRVATSVYKSTHRALSEGDIVVFFSDGLSEGANDDGDEFGGIDLDGSSPLQKALIALASLPAAEIRDGLKAALDRFTGREIPEDDISIVVIKLNKKIGVTQVRNCPYQEALQAWLRSDEKDDSALLRGKRLLEALEWAKDREVSRLETEFLEASQRINEREQMQAQLLEAAQSRAAAADRLEKLSQDLAKSLEAERLHRLQAEMGEMNERIVALTISSEALYLSNNHIEALIAGVIGGVKLRQLASQFPNSTKLLKANTQIRTITALEQVVYGIHESNRLEGHGYWVNKVCFSPDGKLLASASSDRTIKIWSLNGSLLQTLIGHTNWVTSVAFSPDGQLLASASRDNTLRLWKYDTSSGMFYERPAQTFKGHEGPVLDVCFHPDGDQLASASEDTTVRVWKLNGSMIKTMRGHERWVTCISYSPNGKLLASGSADRLINLWNVNGTIYRTLKGHDSFVESLAFAPNGQALVTGSRDRTVKLWGADGVLLNTLSGHTDKVWGVAFSPDGRLIASGSSDRTVKIWDTEGNLLETFSGHGDVVNALTFHTVNDGKSSILASASRDTTVKLWNIKGNPVRSLSGHADEVNSVALSPNGKVLVAGCRDKMVYLWNATNGASLGVLEGHGSPVNCVAFSPDGSSFLSASGDSSIRSWHADGTPIDTLSGHRAEVYCIVYRPDGQVFASCSADSTVRVWRADGTWLQTLNGHTAEVYSIAYSPDGTMLASASKDKTVNIWSWDGTLMRTLDGHSAEVFTVCFGPDGQTLATGSMDQSVKIWSVDGTLLKTLNGHSAEVRSVSYSPDGKSLVSASEDTTVQFWSVDGTLLRTFNGHKAPVRSVCFSSNGKTLISAGADRSIILWNLDLDNLLVRGCRWLQEYLKTNTNVSDEDRRTCLGGCSWLSKFLQAQTAPQQAQRPANAQQQQRSPAQAPARKRT